MRAKTAAWARENAAGWDLREPSVVVSTVNRDVETKRVVAPLKLQKSRRERERNNNNKKR